MPNGIRPEGDDQKWKRETDAAISELQKQIRILTSRQGGSK